MKQTGGGTTPCPCLSVVSDQLSPAGAAGGGRVMGTDGQSPHSTQRSLYLAVFRATRRRTHTMNSSAAASSSVGFADSFVDFFVAENSHPVLRNWFLVREFFAENFCRNTDESQIAICSSLCTNRCGKLEFFEFIHKSSTISAAIRPVRHGRL